MENTNKLDSLSSVYLASNNSTGDELYDQLLSLKNPTTKTGKIKFINIPLTNRYPEETGGLGKEPPAFEPIISPAPIATTMALGEEDGGIGCKPPHFKPVKPIFTTGGCGEEGGGIIALPPQYTTMALGEEDGGRSYKPPHYQPIRPAPISHPINTTYAIGEEGGDHGCKPPHFRGKPVDRITTLGPNGEEDSSIGHKPPHYKPIKPAPISHPINTTYAIGEEDEAPILKPPSIISPIKIKPIKKPVIPRDMVTTIALGEEGGSIGTMRPPQFKPL